MKIVDFKGKEYKINLALYTKQRANCSSLHKAARELLHKLFPFASILEEVPLPERMFADFFLPDKGLIIEVQGQQHYEYNNHFYSNKLEFVKAKARDNKKEELAKINGMTLIKLPYNEDIDGWTSRITSRND